MNQWSRLSTVCKQGGCWFSGVNCVQPLCTLKMWITPNTTEWTTKSSKPSVNQDKDKDLLYSAVIRLMEIWGSNHCPISSCLHTDKLILPFCLAVNAPRLMSLAVWPQTKQLSEKCWASPRNQAGKRCRSVYKNSRHKTWATCCTQTYLVSPATALN